MQPEPLLPGDRVLQVDPRKLRRDIRLQPRAKVDPKTGAYAEHVKDLLAQIQMGCDLTGGRDGKDPIMVYRDPPDDWLAHGYHRVPAYIEFGAKQIFVVVRNGTFRDAQFYALGCNKEPMLKRDRLADIERIMRLMLADPEWADWSNVRIGKHCGVDDKTVGNWKRRLDWEAKEARRQERERQRQATQRAAQQEEGESEGEDGEEDVEDDGADLGIPRPKFTPVNGSKIQLERGPDDVPEDDDEIEALMNKVWPAQRPVDPADEEEVAERVAQLKRAIVKVVKQCANLGWSYMEGSRKCFPRKLPAAH